MVQIDLKSKIREVQDFPKPGILFYDITTMLEDKDALRESIDRLYESVKGLDIDKVVAIESRGYVFAVPLALKLGCGFVMIRKPKKLPYNTLAESYDLEYGSNTIEVHEDSIKPGEKVLMVDDLLATGGTMSAAVKLVEKLGGDVAKILFLIELTFLHGRKKLSNYDIHALLKYDK